MLSPEEVEELVPILNMEGVNSKYLNCQFFVFAKSKLVWTNQQIHGGLLTPNEGHIDPYSLTQVSLEFPTFWLGAWFAFSQAVANGARKRGARIMQQAEVRINERHLEISPDMPDICCWWHLKILPDIPDTCCWWQVLGLDAKRDGGWEVHTGLGTVTTNRCKISPPKEHLYCKKCNKKMRNVHWTWHCNHKQVQSDLFLEDPQNKNKNQIFLKQ